MRIWRAGKRDAPVGFASIVRFLGGGREEIDATHVIRFRSVRPGRPSVTSSDEAMCPPAPPHIVATAHSASTACQARRARGRICGATWHGISAWSCAHLVMAWRGGLSANSDQHFSRELDRQELTAERHESACECQQRSWPWDNCRPIGACWTLDRCGIVHWTKERTESRVSAEHTLKVTDSLPAICSVPEN